MASGSILIDLILKTGSFTTDTERASKSLKKFQKDAEAVGKAIGVAFTGAVVGLAAIVKSSIDSADHLNDLAKKTGIAADTLGGIGFAAEQAGGDLDSAALAAGKLNKSLAEAAAGNKEASEAFKLLGIDVKDATGKTKSADVALAELADKFASYADGPEKTALALRIFGKAGADMIPLLDEGGAALLANVEYFKRYSGVTQETAKAADQFNDTQTKLKLLVQAFGNTLASESLPLLQTLADRFLSAKEQGDGFKGAADGIVSVLKGLVVAGAYVVDTFRGIGREIGALAAQGTVLSEAFSDASLLEKTSPVLMMKRLTEAFRSAQFTGISDAVQADGVQAKKDLDAFVASVLNGTQAAPASAGFSDARFAASQQPKKAAPRLSGGKSSAVADTAGQELKKRLDGQLRLIQDFERSQADAYRVGETYLAGVYEDGLTSQRDFFDAQKRYREAHLQNVLDAIDKEIAAQEAFIANPASKATDRVAAEEKIKLAVQQRADAVTRASADEILATQANARAVLQLQDAYDSLKASTLTARGDDIGAQRLRDAQELRKAEELVRNSGGSQQDVEDLKAVQSLRLARMKAQQDYTKLLDETGRKEQKIFLDAQLGGKGELETLMALRDARQAAIGQLQAQADAAARIAASPYATPDDIQRAEDLALAIKKAAVELDPLADKFRDIFTDAGSNAFANLFSGKATPLQAARQFGSEIATALTDSIAKDVSNYLFGKNGIFGDIGGALSSLFGGKSSSDAGSSALSSSFSTLQTVGITPATSALQLLAQAAGAASTSLGGSTTAASSGGDSVWGAILEGVGSYFAGSYDYSGGAIAANSTTGAAIRGRRAAGGPVMPNSAYLVGERGPEILRLGNQGGTVIPNAQQRQPQVINNNFSIAGPVDRRTEQQIATAAGLGVRRAMARGA